MIDSGSHNVLSVGTARELDERRAGTYVPPIDFVHMDSISQVY